MITFVQSGKITFVPLLCIGHNDNWIGGIVTYRTHTNWIIKINNKTNNKCLFYFNMFISDYLVNKKSNTNNPYSALKWYCTCSCLLFTRLHSHWHHDDLHISFILALLSKLCTSFVLQIIGNQKCTTWKIYSFS